MFPFNVSAPSPSPVLPFQPRLLFPFQITRGRRRELFTSRRPSAGSPKPPSRRKTPPRFSSPTRRVEPPPEVRPSRRQHRRQLGFPRGGTPAGSCLAGRRTGLWSVLLELGAEASWWCWCGSGERRAASPARSGLLFWQGSVQRMASLVVVGGAQQWLLGGLSVLEQSTAFVLKGTNLFASPAR